MGDMMATILFPVGMLLAAAWLIGLHRYRRYLQDNHPKTYRRLGRLPGLRLRANDGFTIDEIGALFHHIGFIVGGGWRQLKDAQLNRLCAWLRVIFLLAFPLCIGAPLSVFLSPATAPRHDAAVTDNAAESEPDAVARLIYEGYQLWEGGAVEDALAVYDEAAALAPENDQVYYYRGIALADAGYLEDAATDFSRAGELNPTLFDAYLRLDQVCAQNRQWDTIIEHWNRFIAHNPDHARAYMERAGAYHHSGNQRAAVADLKRACDLGEAVGCRYYKKYGP